MAGSAGQPKLFQENTNNLIEGPVECLGMIFEHHNARREHYLNRLREAMEELQDKLGGVQFTSVEDTVKRMQTIHRWPMGEERSQIALAERMENAGGSIDLLERWKIELGFPSADIENILDVSDPPYYTACPNPFVSDIVNHWMSESGRLIPAGRAENISGDSKVDFDLEAMSYHREPFAKDVSAGKQHPLYSAFTYHTKIPPEAVMAYIEHYCPEKGIVFDGFCGSGMVGLAARLTNRQAILADLAPSATLIAAAYCGPVSPKRLQAAVKDLVNWLNRECGWLYEVRSEDSQLIQSIEYVIWSEQYRCSNCQEEFLFSDVGFDFTNKKPRDELKCPQCDALLSSRTLERCLDHNGKTKERPVRVKYVSRKRIQEHAPLDVDLELLKRVSAEKLPYPYPDEWMMRVEPESSGWGDMWRSGYHSGVWKVADFFYPRTLWVLAAALHYIEDVDLEPNVRTTLRSAIVNSAGGMTRMRRAYQGTLPLVLYIPRTSREVNAIGQLETRLDKLVGKLGTLDSLGPVAISTQSSTSLPNIPSQSADYIFTDPPFGKNIIYSEVNFIWESFLGIYTSQHSEAIISSHQNKGLFEYRVLMTECFSEYFRVLKPGRWMTVEFHNSQNSIWNAIQEAIQLAGFVIADVRTLDKQQGSFKQVTAPNTVKHDLIISCYKPPGNLDKSFRRDAGTEEGLWAFIRVHLRNLPVFVSTNGQAEVVAERQAFLLFDRMVAFHVQRGVTVPLSAAEFYAGLAQRFPERDGMYFLPEQAAEYDKKRLTVKDVQQLQLFVTDEESSILWLKQQLTKKSQTFQELHPQFLKEIGGWQKHEKPLELSGLLEQNFLRYDGKGEVPSQIHSYLSSNYKDLRNLPKDDEGLHSKAKDRWYVPDPNKQVDLEKLRERTLLREFKEYREAKQKRLKVFRLEAVRAGFKKAWQERDYETIIAVAEKIPEKVLQEDPKLLMWYDQAIIRNADT